MSYRDGLRRHDRAVWGAAVGDATWTETTGTARPLDGFSVLVFGPRAKRRAWTYATCGMSVPSIGGLLELHLFSPIETAAHLELLTVVAAYHRRDIALALGDTVNIGRPWLPGSHCDHALVSLPYLDGPAVEDAALAEGRCKCYWLVPITKAERDFKHRHGVEALEQRFEAARFDYLDPQRPCVTSTA